MSKNQRRGGRFLPRRNDSLNRFKLRGSNTNGTGSLAASIRPQSKEKNLANRSCYITPETVDFSQYFDNRVANPEEYKDTGQATHPTCKDQYQTLLQNDFNFEPVSSENFEVPEGFISVSCGTFRRVKNSFSGLQWQKVDSGESVDKLLMSSEAMGTNEVSKDEIFIREIPSIKVIAEKFSRYKKNNLEVRRLEEKVVCVEYDIFDKAPYGSELKPVQKMRAFFSIKPFGNDSGEKREPRALPKLPSNIKNKFDVVDEDLTKLTEKEIELIDATLDENKSYLDDLRRILKRKTVIKAKKNNTSLDLLSLYEMAKRDRPPLYFDFSQTNFLSKAGLKEVRQLILQQCTSNVNGFRRRRIERTENGSGMDVGVISESFVAELLRDDAKRDV